jgi:hypothetical protein
MTTNEHNYDLEFKVLKRDLKVTYTDTDGLRYDIKISFVSWSRFARAKTTEPDLDGNTWTSLRHAYLCSSTVGVLQSRELITTRDYARLGYMSRRTTVTDPYALTPLGVAVHAAMPKVPPQSEWPAAAPRKPLSPDNIRVTDHQRALLAGIRDHSRMVGYAVNDPEKKLDGLCFHEFGRGHHPYTESNIRKFLTMELVELGFCETSLELGVRLTPHGALLAEDDD